jgi:hypothetical protein
MSGQSTRLNHLCCFSFWKDTADGKYYIRSRDSVEKLGGYHDFKAQVGTKMMVKRFLDTYKRGRMLQVA